MCAWLNLTDVVETAHTTRTHLLEDEDPGEISILPIITEVQKNDHCKHPVKKRGSLSPKLVEETTKLNSNGPGNSYKL